MLSASAPVCCSKIQDQRGEDSGGWNPTGSITTDLLCSLDHRHSSSVQEEHCQHLLLCKTEIHKWKKVFARLAFVGTYGMLCLCTVLPIWCRAQLMSLVEWRGSKGPQHVLNKVLVGLSNSVWYPLLHSFPNLELGKLRAGGVFVTFWNQLSDKLSTLCGNLPGVLRHDWVQHH